MDVLRFTAIRKPLGYTLMAFSYVPRAAILTLPWLHVSLSEGAAIATGLIIAGETAFYTGLLLAGKDVREKVKTYWYRWRHHQRP